MTVSMGSGQPANQINHQPSTPFDPIEQGRGGIASEKGLDSRVLYKIVEKSGLCRKEKENGNDYQQNQHKGTGLFRADFIGKRQSDAKINQDERKNNRHRHKTFKERNGLEQT